MKDNRKNLKEGFVYPGTSKEESKKKHYKGMLARKFTSVQKAEGTEPLCSSLSKYTLLLTESPWGQRLNYSSLAPSTPNPQREEEGILIIALWTWDFHLFYYFFFLEYQNTFFKRNHTRESKMKNQQNDESKGVIFKRFYEDYKIF